MDSQRLQRIVELIPDGAGVADIGTDHAQIPIHLARHTNCRPIIAGEKNPGPYQGALQRVREAGLEQVIDLRHGSGLSILKPHEVSWAVVAGMGFKTMVEEVILPTEAVARSLKGLILQPMQGPDEMRRWLLAHNYIIKDELLVKEDGKLFQILLVHSGQTQPVSDEVKTLLHNTGLWSRDFTAEEINQWAEVFYEVGPVLYKNGDPHLTEHLQNLIAYYTDVLSQVPEEGERAVNKRAKLAAHIVKLKEVLDQWLKRCNESSTSSTR